MIAQRIYTSEDFEVIRPRKRRKATLMDALIQHRMASFLAIAAIFFIAASTYVSAYARFMEKGYCKAALLSNLSQLKKENQKLRLSLDESRQPERIETFARANGMLQSQRTAYIEPAVHPHVAMNVERTAIR